MKMTLAMFVFILVCCLAVTSSAQESVVVCRDRTDVTSYATRSGTILVRKRSIGHSNMEWIGCLWNARCPACPWSPGNPLGYEPPLFASITNHHSYIEQDARYEHQATFKCRYKDDQTEWWFTADDQFPTMRVVNKRCVICFGCSMKDTDSMCISYWAPCPTLWQPGDPDDDVFKPFSRLHY